MTEFHGCRTVRELIPRQAYARPDAIALIHRERTTTYGELDARAKQVANGLLAIGVRPGDRIAYLGKNSDRYFELLFGAIAANIVLAPVNWRLAPPEMTSLLQDAEAKVLFVGKGFADIAASLELPALDRFVAMDEAQFGWMEFEEWRNAQSSNDPDVPADPDDTVLQLYTSGTTGLPKGVELTNTNILTFIDCYESHDVVRLSP
jgi:fatty-acyl-CoA synthase